MKTTISRLAVLLSATSILSLAFGCGAGGNASFSPKGGSLVSIQVSPAKPSIALGTTRQFTATGVYSNNTTQDLTASVAWTSSNASVATVSAAGLATATGTGTTTITATTGSLSGAGTLTVTAATLTSIEVTPANASIALGTTQQFVATGVFSDNTTQNLTATAAWTSSNNAVATVSNTGSATSAAVGSATITATFSGVSGGAGLTVTAATLTSIQVTPANPSIALGTTQQFTATGTFSDKTTKDLSASVTWSSSDTSHATVGAAGLATGVGTGTAAIQAALGTVSNSTTLTVTPAALKSLTITPTNRSMAQGTTLQFSAAGIFTDNSKQDVTKSVLWSSSSPTSVVTIDNGTTKGLASGWSAGTTTIAAASGSVSDSTSLTVTGAILSSIQVTPTNPGIGAGTTQQFTATGIFSDKSAQNITASALWSSSSSTSIATIDNGASKGLASGWSAGSSVISATSGTVAGSTTLTVIGAALSSVQVSPVNPGIAAGTTRQFTATAVYSNGSVQDITGSAAWSSSDTAVATIDGVGLASSLKGGSTTITATLGGKSGASTLTVNAVTLDAIQVSPVNPDIAFGTIKQFTATGVYSDNTTQDLTATASWSSSAPAVAAISNSAGENGLATAVGSGTTVISAAVGLVSGSATLKVNPVATLTAVKITPVDPVIAPKTSQQLRATGYFSDGTVQDLTALVTWSSSTSGVAVSNIAGENGLATAVTANSSALVSAASGSVSGSTTLSVSSALLSSLEVSPSNPTLAAGVTRQFTATGIYSDGTTQDLTGLATWSSGNTNAAVISNAAGSNGLATALASGKATISASFSGKSASTGVSVTAATLQSIQISPANPSVSAGLSQQFTALGVYLDNSIQDLTGLVTWSSGNTNAAVISNAAGSNGLATAMLSGSATITATLGSVSGSTTLSVSGATLLSIDVTPMSPEIILGLQQQFTATGIFSDYTTMDLTPYVVWSTLDSAIASISNAPGSAGQLTSLATGTTTVTAAFGAVSDTTDITVASPALNLVDVTPTNPVIARGTVEQFWASGYYSDGSVQDLTTPAIWSSSDQTIATVSNTPGSNGLATPLAAGPTTISASFGGMAGTATLTVSAATITAITVTPATTQIAVGTTMQFIATADVGGVIEDITASVVWTSSNTGIATISNTGGANGLASGVTTGAVTITAALGSVTSTASLTINPLTLKSISITSTSGSTTLAVGVAVPFKATGLFNDNTTQDLTTQVTWKSASKTVATVSNLMSTRGQVTGVAVGGTVISASVTISGILYTSSIPVMVSSLTKLEIFPLLNVTLTMIKGGKAPTQQYKAIGTYADGTTQDLTKSTTLTWSSSNTAAATIVNRPASKKGLATAVAAGVTTITAQVKGSLSATTTLTVK